LWSGEVVAAATAGLGIWRASGVSERTLAALLEAMDAGDAGDAGETVSSSDELDSLPEGDGSRLPDRVRLSMLLDISFPSALVYSREAMTNLIS
jgi:hypothetical protein